MDNDTEDFNDAAWDQASQEERAQVEQAMLTGDPGYAQFLRTYQEQK